MGLPERAAGPGPNALMRRASPPVVVIGSCSRIAGCLSVRSVWCAASLLPLPLPRLPRPACFASLPSRSAPASAVVALLPLVMHWIGQGTAEPEIQPAIDAVRPPPLASPPTTPGLSSVSAAVLHPSPADTSQPRVAPTSGTHQPESRRFLECDDTRPVRANTSDPGPGARQSAAGEDGTARPRLPASSTLRDPSVPIFVPEHESIQRVHPSCLPHDGLLQPYILQETGSTDIGRGSEHAHRPPLTLGTAASHLQRRRTPKICQTLASSSA
ncbi:hypothetical protein CDD83_9104 [Cordyceps sp. RAO-2017]|nr:hypothetical protein CDD83_9104 [Cordyceps sp. RAO-2017]